MLDSPNIQLHLLFDAKSDELDGFDAVVWTGRLDEYYRFVYGRLPFASIYQKLKMQKNYGQFQAPVINYPCLDFKYIRKTNYSMIIHPDCHYVGFEYPLEGNTPVYPILTHKAENLKKKYLTKIDENVFFAGRLGKYQYNSMDSCVQEAFQITKQIIKLDSRAGTVYA